MSGRPIPGLPPPQPIPIRERSSILFVEKGRLDVLDGAFVLVDENGIRTHMPIGGLVCLMLEPGTRVSHSAVVLAARAGTLLIWVGEGRGKTLCGRPARGCPRRSVAAPGSACAGRRPAFACGAQDVRPSVSGRPAGTALGGSAAWHRRREGAGDLPATRTTPWREMGRTTI
jgi:hypothetical protein